MAHDDSGSDLGVGVGTLLSVVAVLAAVGMAVTDPSATYESGMHTAAVPFAIAMTAGIAGVAAIHLLWE
ncbi:hypothetical protein [Halolamina sp.]|jgi:hypothetical protein|uniref:DUF7525 family protein n=1 Tax=Halolamina sp. TaxID=1940283 RepID=UPI000223C09E|nr:hypothetical protein Halar_3510 [halophilic archaeon DL31]